jgi:hypothetical protein
MTALPPANQPWVDPKTGIPTQAFYQYMNDLLPNHGSDVLARALRSAPITFANRPNPPTEGMIVSFIDSMTATSGATIAGGGTYHVLGYYNKTAWVVL